jgi:paraquat-inducible protein B
MNPAPSPAPHAVRPAVVRRRRYFSIVWLVPILAAAVAGYLLYHRYAQAGPEITINFEDGSGLKPRQSVLRYRGVAVGDVRSVTLSKDLKTAVVKARLTRSAADLARKGSLFWIVRPQVGVQNITGLNTIVTGSYIEVVPGTGEPEKRFTGANTPPMENEEEGLRITLLSAVRGSITLGSPVYYRGIEVGLVRKMRLSDDARAVEFEAFIQKQYAPLVREDSRFWNVSGVDIDFSLLRGAEINVESLKSLLSGGIAFATPDAQASKTVPNGAAFRLHAQARKEWLEWAPAILVGDPKERDERERTRAVE